VGAMDGLINEYIAKLTDTKTPHLILASVYKSLFDKDLQAKDWPQLQRLIKIYGRWRVFESFLKASSNFKFDTTANVWGYFNAICVSLLEEEKQNSASIFKVQQEKELTQKILNDLGKRNKLKLKDKAWLTSNKG
jgi:hypothetical protein